MIGTEHEAYLLAKKLNDKRDTGKRKIGVEKARRRNAMFKKAYKAHECMLGRCYNEHDPEYKNYGGRGIEVCDKWKNDRLQFIIDILETNYGLFDTVDRIDVNGDYEPCNVRGAGVKLQNQNRRCNTYLEHNGERKCLSEWCREFGIQRATLRTFLKEHTFEEAYDHYVNGKRFPRSDAKKFEHNGRVDSIRGWETEFGLSHGTLYKYLEHHTFEEAYEHYAERK